VNIGSFGMCSSPTNPQVAAATAAAMGVLMPQPCAPIVTGPWIPGSQTVAINGVSALHDACRCACQWGGLVQIQGAGQDETEVD
jgi:hypothetical protein